MQITYRAAMAYDTYEASQESALLCTDPSRTQQQFRDEVDINQIVARFVKQGEMPMVKNPPTYADYSQTVNDYQTAMNIVREAQESFMTLPAKVRDRFNNDPQQLLQFVQDPDNQAAAEKLGLTTPKPAADNPPADSPAATKE